MIDINSTTLHQDIRNQIKMNILCNLIKIKELMHMSHDNFKEYLGIVKQTTYNAQQNAKEKGPVQNHLLFLGVLSLMDNYIITQPEDDEAKTFLTEIFFNGICEVADCNYASNLQYALNEKLRANTNMAKFYVRQYEGDNNPTQTFMYKWFSLINTEDEAKEILTFELEELVQNHRIYLTYNFLKNKENHMLLKIITDFLEKYKTKLYASYALIKTLDHMIAGKDDEGNNPARDMRSIIEKFIERDVIAFFDTSIEVSKETNDVDVIKKHLKETKRGIVLISENTLNDYTNKHINDVVGKFSEETFKQVYCLESSLKDDSYRVWNNKTEIVAELFYDQYLCNQDDGE